MLFHVKAGHSSGASLRAGNILSMYKQDSIWTNLYFVSGLLSLFLLIAISERNPHWENPWTDHTNFVSLICGYWTIQQDEFAILPAVVPEGPIAILGLVCFPWHLLAFLSCAFTFVIIQSVVDCATFLCVYMFEEPISFLGCLWRVAQDDVS